MSLGWGRDSYSCREKGGKWKSEVAHSCPTLCNTMDCSLPDSFVNGIFQAKYWSGLPFSSPGDLFQSREWTRVSGIAGRLLSIWASREALATLFILLPIRADLQDSASPSHTDALWIIQRHCTCAFLILYPSSYIFTSHSLSPVSPNAITRSVHPTLLPSGPTTALWVSVLLCLLQVLNVSSFCCLVELAKLNRK